MVRITCNEFFVSLEVTSVIRDVAKLAEYHERVDVSAVTFVTLALTVLAYSFRRGSGAGVLSRLRPEVLAQNDIPTWESAKWRMDFTFVSKPTARGTRNGIRYC